MKQDPVEQQFSAATHHPRLDSRRGFLDPKKVRAFAFWTIAVCILISVLASVLAIWKFADTDTLWRTVATCIVVAGGTAAFAVVNAAFGAES